VNRPANAFTLADVPGLTAIAAGRPRMEREVIEAKRARRVALGPSMTLLFENRTTLLWQVLEMCRVEHITRPAAIQHEIDTYGAMLPGPRELSATLLIEYADEAARSRQLRALVGFERHVELRLEGCAPSRGRFDESQANGERVSSVQFVRFPLGEAQLGVLGNLSLAASVACTHPAYVAEVTLSPTTRAALVEDLRAAG